VGLESLAERINLSSQYGNNIVNMAEAGKNITDISFAGQSGRRMEEIFGIEMSYCGSRDLAIRAISAERSPWGVSGYILCMA
jgi:hypothetical protein